MSFTGTVAATFSASHVVDKHPRCGRLHGHRWSIEVEIKVGQDPETGELVDLPALADAVEQFCSELHREHVNDMLPASHPTPAGVALAVRERLALQFRTISRVTVCADEMCAVLDA